MKHEILQASLLSVFAIGCVGDDLQRDVADDVDDPAAMPVPQGDAQALRFETCAAIVAHSPNALDGDYTLHVGGDAAKPWTAYCHDMAGTPAEYLTLRPDRNFSQYTAGAFSPGTDVRTSYTRVRIDPIALAIDITDQTFSSSTGSLDHSFGAPVTSMPYGVAMNCGGAPGVANIDLGNAPFTIADPFAVVGAGAQGLTTLSANGRAVALVGEGGCGWNAAEGAPFDPFNTFATPNFVLDLVYSAI